MSRKLAALFGALLVGAALVGTGVAVAGMGADTASRSTSAAGSGDGPARTIEVSTTGTAQARPDEAVIRLSVEAVADDPTTARTRVADNVSRMTDALAELGVDEERIRTVDFDLRERRDPRRSEGEDGSGVEYWASHALAIEVEDVDRVGEIVDVAVDNGATNVHDVRFTLADETRRELRTRALEDAMSNARQQANTIAGSADLAVTGVHSVSTADVRVPYPRVTMEAAADGSGGGTDISSGPVTVSATVGVTFNATGA